MSEPLTQKTINLQHAAQISVARREARSLAAALGFDEVRAEEIALVASELAANVVQHAGAGQLALRPLAQEGRRGLELLAADAGPGIPDVAAAVRDGFSTRGGLGYGLGTVHRLMDECTVVSPVAAGRGTEVRCRRWLPAPRLPEVGCPLAWGACTRARPGIGLNGDAVVGWAWDHYLLVGVIDGVGHGQFAYRAAQTARHYVETHAQQPLGELFRGVGGCCRATRGVVMALARFDWQTGVLSFASIGNVTTRILGPGARTELRLRRGIVGANAPEALVGEFRWVAGNALVMHSDGVANHWAVTDFPTLLTAPPAAAAERLVAALARHDDDATAVIVRRAQS